MMPSTARKYLTRRANQRHYSIITPSVLQTSTVKFAGESETFSRSQDEVFETHRGACHHYASAIALVVGRAFARPVGIAGRTMRPGCSKTIQPKRNTLQRSPGIARDALAGVGSGDVGEFAL